MTVVLLITIFVVINIRGKHVYSGVWLGFNPPPNPKIVSLNIKPNYTPITINSFYGRVTYVCQIFKKIRENSDDGFKQILSNSEESMSEGFIEIPRTVGRQIARNNIIKDQYFYLFWIILFVNYEMDLLIIIA